MLKRVNLWIFLCVLIGSFFSSCTFSVSKQVKKYAVIRPSIVPQDYNPNKHILLVADLPRLNKPDERNNAATKKLDDAFKEYCPYKYEIVSVKDIYENKSKYGDTSVYKYAILNTLHTTWHTTTTTTTITDNTGTHSSSVSPSARSTEIDLRFFDRTTKYNYPTSGNGSVRIKFTVAAFIVDIQKAKG